MTETNLFSSIESNEPEKNEPEQTPQVNNADSNVVPSEAIAASNSPYEQLNDEQKIEIKEIEATYENAESINHDIVINEYNKAYNEKSLDFWNNDLPQKFVMALAIMNSVLIEMAKLKTFTIIALGKSTFLSKDKQYAISTLVAIIQYEIENETTGNMIAKEEIKIIKKIDKVGESTDYKSLIKCLPFFTYEPLLIKDKKHNFELSEFTNFDMGTPPSEELSKLTDRQLYESIGIKIFDDIKVAGLTKLDDSNNPDATDLKAIKVFLPKPTTFTAPKTFPDIEGLSSNKALDFKGNAIILYFTAYPEMKMNFVNLGKDERIAGIAIGTLKENKSGDCVMSVFNFLPFGGNE